MCRWTNEPAPDRRRGGVGTGAEGWYRMRDGKGESATGEDVERGVGKGEEREGGELWGGRQVSGVWGTGYSERTRVS